MTFTRPYVTRYFVDYELGDFRLRELSIAFRPIDQFTLDPPLLQLRALLKELPTLPPVRNLSGFLCFEDVQPGNYTLVVQRDPEIVDSFYVKPAVGPWTTDTLEVPLTVVANTVLSFDLQLAPRPSYPFPQNATLVRGTVTQGSPAGVANAIVRATYEEIDPLDNTQNIPKTVEALTNNDGEYAVFFKRLPRVKDGDPPLTADLFAIKGPNQSQTVTVEIKEGETVKVDPLDLPV